MSKKGLDFKFTIMNKKLLLIAVMLFASFGAFAQTQFSIYGGGAFPMGKLKAGELKDKFPEKWALINEKGDQGYAGLGFNLGIDVLFPINSVDGLGITLGADFFYNGYNSELKDYISDLEDAGDEYDSYTLKKPRIMNAPIMLGARYLYEVSNGFGIFAEAGLGLNLRFISNLNMSYEYEYEDYDPYYGYETYDVERSTTYKYKTVATFTFKVGAGIMIADHLSIGVDFYALGNSKVKADITSDYTIDGYSDSEKIKFKGKSLRCSELAVRIGYHF